MKSSAHFDWLPVLNALAKRGNPILKTIPSLGFGGYYWVADQCAIATDILFKDRATLQAILPDLFEHAILHSASQDTLRFLGRKLHGNYKGDATIDLKKHPAGWRVKYISKRNSIKMYDKLSVLWGETTINNPSEFKICQQVEDGSLRWQPMGKGVSNLYRYAEIGLQANQRLLEHLAQANLKSKAIPHLDSLYRSHARDGKRFVRFSPLSEADRSLFVAVMSGEFALNGFRNADLVEKLFVKPAASDKEAKQRCTKLSRLTGKYKRGEPAPAESRGEDSPYVQKYMTDAHYDKLEKLIAFAESRAHTLGELAHAWLLAQPQVASVISGATKVEQVQANAKGGERVLTGEEEKGVRGILEK